ncbi:MAG: S9 family peptidase [Chloroflexota bacterium]
MSAEPQAPMRPEDITRVCWISDPRISPDGRRVAFVVTTVSQEKDESLANIWVVEVDQGSPRRFTTGQKRDSSPRWSPDGRWLAFVSDREPKKKAQLYLMPGDGGEPTRLTDLKAGVSAPVWSPDGSRIAFLARVGGWQEPEDEEEKARSKPARVISTLKHKYNGEGFVYDRRPHVFVVSATGGEPRQVTDGDFADGEPGWSPDGAWLAFASARHASRDQDNVRDVWVVAAEGGEPRQVTDGAGPVDLPSFSPDGRTIAYLGHRFVNEAGRNDRVFTVPFEGGAATCLTDALDRSVGQPVWAGETGWLLFPIDDHGNGSIYRVRSGGATPPEAIVSGTRQCTEPSVCSDGQTVAFLISDPVSPPEVFVSQADGSGERPLTDLNREWKAATALSRPEHVSYHRDGFELDCWVMKPIGFAPGHRYPALLNVHGGPMASYGNRFFDEFQVYAGAGYVVIYTNPRGSQGYGESFTRAVVGDWGGGDYRDVLAGLDAAVEQCDVVDPERLGVLGGSYGGFMTSWIVGHTDRFRAACSERAVNNLYSFFGTSDIGPSFARAQTGHLPWTNRAWYVERSPLTYAENVRTPLLIVHSADDLRCPIEQGEQLFMALKAQGKEATFVRFPDENHELSRAGRPRHRLERFRYILEWFDRHLQPEPTARRT